MNFTRNYMNLRSRYGDTWTLEKIDGGLKFVLPPYTRIGFNESPEILDFIDPPGGPFLQVGDNIGEKKILGIENKDSYVIIKLEEA